MFQLFWEVEDIEFLKVNGDIISGNSSCKLFSFSRIGSHFWYIWIFFQMHICYITGVLACELTKNVRAVQKLKKYVQRGKRRSFYPFYSHCMEIFEGKCFNFFELISWDPCKLLILLIQLFRELGEKYVQQSRKLRSWHCRCWIYFCCFRKTYVGLMAACTIFLYLKLPTTFL